MKTIHPISRLLFLVFGIIGVIICIDLFLMMGYWIYLVMLYYISGYLKVHIKFFSLIIIPVLLFLLIIWGGVMEKAPYKYSYDYTNGYVFAIYISLRLLLLGSLFQLTFITIHHDNYIDVFKKWGIKGNLLIIILGALTVFPDLIKKADKIMTAIYARGIIPNRSIINRFRQFPLILKPLIINSLQSAVDRTESWYSKNLIKRMEESQVKNFRFKIIDSVIISLTFLWFLSNLYIYIIKTFY